MVWYDLLITDEFLNFFAQGSENYATHGTFRKFSDTVEGITLAFGGCSDDLMKYLTQEADIYDACKQCKENLPAVSLADIWHSIPCESKKSPYDVAMNTLTAEQIAVLILYPFWHRMGVGSEIDFAESGKLNRYLLELKKKRSVG